MSDAWRADRGGVRGARRFLTGLAPSDAVPPCGPPLQCTYLHCGHKALRSKQSNARTCGSLNRGSNSSPRKMSSHTHQPNERRALSCGDGARPAGCRAHIGARYCAPARGRSPGPTYRAPPALVGYSPAHSVTSPAPLRVMAHYAKGRVGRVGQFSLAAWVNATVGVDKASHGALIGIPDLRLTIYPPPV
jgi:hypothetical protein